MKPSERIDIIFKDWTEKYSDPSPENRIANKLMSVIQYLDEEWEKDKQSEALKRAVEKVKRWMMKI